MSGAVAVSILIPAWDEEATVGAVVAGAMADFRTAGILAECLVCVDARTTDRTAQAALTAGARTILQRGRGLTAAVLELAEAASGDVCVVLDGDGQHDASCVACLAAPILAGHADLVTGARDPALLRQGFGEGQRGALRYSGARLLASAARLALRQRVPDPLTGMFASRRDNLLVLRERPRLAPPEGYKLILGLLALTPAERIRHRTVPFLLRLGGGSKLGARVLLTTVGQLLVVLLYCRWRSAESSESLGAKSQGDVTVGGS